MAIDIPRLDAIKTPPGSVAEPDLRVRPVEPEPRVPADPVQPDPQRWQRGDRRRGRARDRRKARVVRRLEQRSGVDRRKGHIIDVFV